MAELFAATAAEGRWVLTEAVNVEARAAGFAATLDGEANGVFVAEDEAGAIVGELIARPSVYGYAELGMDVEKSWRGHGVGTALLVACIDWARGEGLHKLSLEVFPHNEAGLALYRKLGFVEEGVRRGHYRRRNGELWDAVLMGLQLG